MFPIIKKENLADRIVSLTIEAPRIAASCAPGQFVIVKADEAAERIPLTIADYDLEERTITIVVQSVGRSTEKIDRFQEGEAFHDVLGPLGKPSAFLHQPKSEISGRRYLFVGGGLGIAPCFPQMRWLHEHGATVEMIVGARTRDLLFWEKKLRSVSDAIYVATDDGSAGMKGRVTDCLDDLILNQGKTYDECICIGPMIMMKFVAERTSEHALDIPTTVSMNPVMVDGTGMCGACRVYVGNEVRFACVDGPEFNARDIDFDAAMKRQRLVRSSLGEPVPLLDPCRREPEQREESESFSGHEQESWNPMRRVPVREQSPLDRIRNFDEVSLGYTEEEAVMEARRCLNCKNPRCVAACPVSIDIPAFIDEIAHGNFKMAFEILQHSSCLPAVCGRVCPQEEQCEGSCLRGMKGDPVAIGRLERFAADWAREQGWMVSSAETKRGQRVAVVGSGPAGLACAGDLAKYGYDVTVFESLHAEGGVLQYGIPSFRLPKKEVVQYEVDAIRQLGVHFETDVLVGQSVTIPELMTREGFDAVFIATGAGLPRFMHIPGESLNGVMSANEFLTRNNLMRAYDESYDTPPSQGRRIVVVGGGNVAMDAARTALRIGAESLIVYRRGEEELPARREEILHAKEEGVQFHFLSNPVEILSDEEGWVRGVRCVRMKLGDPDASGRRRPMAVENSEFELPCDMVIMALGTKAASRAIQGLEELQCNEKGGIMIHSDDGATNIPGIFAGGDAVTGSATVILAMGAGRRAAASIDAYLKEK